MVCCWLHSQFHIRLIWQGLICVGLQDLDPFGSNLAETICTMRYVETLLLDTGSITIVWLTTEAGNQSSLHCTAIYLIILDVEIKA